MEALQRFMLGQQHLNRSTFESLETAKTYFQEATEHDPEYAQAWAAIASVASQSFSTGAIGLQEYKALAEHAVTRALHINNELAEAHAELADLAWQTGDIEKAEASFKTALTLEPNQAWSLRSYGTYLRTTGRSDEAIPVLDKALHSDPLSPLTLFELGKAEMYVGHTEKTLIYAERILEIDPSSVYGYAAHLQAYTDVGRFDLGIPWFIKMMAVDPSDFESWAYFGYWARMLGEPEWSVRYMAGAVERGPNEPTVLKNQVQVLMLQGRSNEATAIARQALEAGLNDRWFSNRIFLRQVRDAALQSGDLDVAHGWYRDRHPELFDRAPDFDVDNINAAADLALLLRQADKADAAAALVAAGINWYETELPQGVYGYVTGIAYVDLLALSGDSQAALDTLRAAVDYGWRYGWPWYLASKNLDSIREAPEFQAIVAELEADMATQLEVLRALPDMGEYDLRYKEERH
jgi:Tfp pilus assembly protein PilF